jgi:magnesium transporter
LLLADPHARIARITDGTFVALSAWDDQEKAVRTFQEYDRVALPVVDSSGVLLGIVTFDDVMDVAEEEATEDIQKLGGMEALDEPYIETGFAQMLRKRAGWLTLLFLGQMLTANAIQYFEGRVSQAWVLVAFMPLIIASGGNSGSQAAALVIRSLALGEVGLRDWWRVMRREVVSGIALGAIVGAIAFLRVAAEQQFLVRAGHEGYGPYWPWLGFALASALVLVVMWGTLVGSMLPFALQRIGADPAASSTPFVSTLVDVTGIIIYFSICVAVLSGTYL